ncbi:polysaccharide biosynthesis protein [Brevibacterium samyangense]|uniref:Nucleoside-diphosphate sugar epimerase/dehydratase n=1 Tax=Brevibacterium samyangense TaxID=366888 RepID=A0ABP5F898_9MICO
MALWRAIRDGLIFAACVWIAALARYDFAVSSPNYAGITVCSVIAFLTFVVLGGWLYGQGRYRRASGDELFGAGAVVAIAAGFMYLGNALVGAPRLVPASVPVSAGAFAIVAIAIVSWSLTTGRHRVRRQSGRSRRALIVGAGHHGMTAFRMITEDPRAEFVAVGFLDDDPNKRLLRVEGVRVMGTLEEMCDVAKRTGADTVIVAIRSFTSKAMQALVERAAEQGLEVKILPDIDAQQARHRGLGDKNAVALRPAGFRNVELNDLIGREPVQTDVDAIASYLNGKTVLVTGAGGSIGSFLCQQIAKYSPGRLVMTDRDESGLHSTQLVLEGQAMLTSDDLVLGDLRDPRFVRTLFKDVRPDIVFHAAALKHLTFLERFPDEAVMTNVGGSLDLLDAAVEYGVDQFVHISTDKAADPTSVLGASKYLTERVIAGIARSTGKDFMSVRFGNVLGSRGSVLGTFVAQAAAGGPLTVTAPGVRRYFMSAAEACELVLQAGAIGNAGETLVLDMGEQVLIEDLAKRVIALSGKPDVEIVYTGLREGEKLEEVRLAAGERDERPNHPFISQVPINPVDVERVRSLVANARTAGHTRNDEIRQELAALVRSTRALNVVQPQFGQGRTA